MHELLLLPTMLAHVLLPSLSLGRVLPYKYEGLQLGNAIVLHISVLVNGVHLLDSAVFDHNIW